MSPEVPILGRMTQVVLLRGWVVCLGGGEGDLDQAEGVVCLGLGAALVGLAAAAAKERVVCLAPGLQELAAAMLYCWITWGLVSLLGM